MGGKGIRAILHRWKSEMLPFVSGNPKPVGLCKDWMVSGIIMAVTGFYQIHLLYMGIIF
jgi:hypothetical protein